MALLSLLVTSLTAILVALLTRTNTKQHKQGQARVAALESAQVATGSAVVAVAGQVSAVEGKVDRLTTAVSEAVPAVRDKLRP